MAFYKQDIVDINLNTGNIFRSFLNHSIGFKNDDADRFGIRVFRDGEPVDLTGASCQAVFMNPLGTNIALTSYGTVSGNVAYVTLPQACYDYEGQFTLSIQLVGGGVTGTMRIVDGMVVNTGASGTVAPTASVPTYQEILSTYDAMVAATSAANLAIAETFDATKAYPAGKYVINEGHLYRLTADHAANVTWANTSKVATNFGDDLNSQKSAIGQVPTGQNVIDIINEETSARQRADIKKVNIPLDENIQPTYGTNGQSLRTKGDGSTEWADVGLPTDEQTAEAVSAWLDKHPEATTTVQDGSLTEEKFTNTLKLKTIKDYVTPEMFGAVGDGIADDTLSLQSMFDYAYEKNTIEPYGVSCIVALTGKVYRTTDTLIHDNVTKVLLIGNTYIKSEVIGKPAWKIVGSINSKSSVEKYAKQELYKKGELYCGGGNICIVATNEKENNTGLEIGTENSTDISICDISGFSIVGFSVGIKLNSVNTYIITFSRIYLEYNRYNFWYGGTTLSNSNERISFVDCTFGHAYRCIYLSKSTSELLFDNCSFDFNTAIIVVDTANGGEITLTGCHIEGTGYYGSDLPQEISADNGYYVYVLGDRRYATLKVNLLNNYIHDTQTKNTAEYRIGAERTTIICDMFHNAFSLTNNRFRSILALCEQSIKVSSTYNSEASTSLLMSTLDDPIGNFSKLSAIDHVDIAENPDVINPFVLFGNTWSTWKYYASTLTSSEDVIFGKSLLITIPGEYSSTGISRTANCKGNWLKVRCWVKCRNLSKTENTKIRVSVGLYDISDALITSANTLYYDYECVEDEWIQTINIFGTSNADHAIIRVALRNENNVKGDIIYGGIIVESCY